MATPPDFSPGQVLTAAHMDAVGLWLVKTQTVGTGVSSVTVNDAFSADYENYRITLTGGVASQDNQFIALKLGASTTQYYGFREAVAYATSVSALGSDNNTTQFTAVGFCSTGSQSVSFDLFNPFNAQYTTFTTVTVRDASAGQAAGIHKVSTSYSSFTLTPNAGTLTGGTIRVYGYRN